MSKFTFSLVVAYSFPSRGIGKDGCMKWHISDDLKRFAIITKCSNPGEMPVVVMGRKTWDSLPKKPLPSRLNIVLSNSMSTPVSTPDDYPNTVFCTFENLLQTLEFVKFSIHPDIKVIGGGEIYKLFLESSLPISRIYATEVYCPKEPEYDTVFVDVDDKFSLEKVSTFNNSKDGIYFRYLTYCTGNEEVSENWKNTEEYDYLNLMSKIISSQCVRDDRTGVGTFSVFGKQLTYDLSDTFPLCTTKKMFMRGIFEELMMYLRGQTDNNILVSKGIHVWDGNTTRSFLDKRGLVHYKEGDMGSTYGFNFRHFGATYKGCDASYVGQGFDQLKEIIRLIKTDPTSRRMIINLWDPQNNQGAALPACLCMYQFYVRDSTYLDLQIYIRSSDYFLANNWNTCTGALFVHLLCSLNGINLTPGTLTVCMGDAHVYSSHINQVNENIKRVPFPFPKLIVKSKKDNIEDFEFSDIRLIGYRSHERISAPMAV